VLPKQADRSAVLAALARRGGVSRDNVVAVSRETGVPEATVYGAGSFYGLLDPEPAVRVCVGLSCELAGAGALRRSLEAAGHRVVEAGCLARCDGAPAAMMEDRTIRCGGGAPAPGRVLPDDPALPINLGGVDAVDGQPLASARALGREGLFDALQASGLRGRGGAGFPAATKWRSVASQDDPVRYVVINADEGEPGTFKDREILLRRPHRVLQGIGIAAWAVGAEQAWIYLRGEMMDAWAALEAAIAEARPELDGVEVRLVAGHGAYICGEETALLESIEGKRGMPRLKPPFPTQSGLFGRPTLMHNVETIATVPFIAQRGGASFARPGLTEPGTRLYCISGAVVSPGVYELPCGVTLNRLIEVAGGAIGAPEAFVPGGAATGFLPMTYADVPLDHASLRPLGASPGSMGVVVLPGGTDLSVAARVQLAFFEDESCGQCAPCRLGTQALRQAMDRFLTTGDAASLAHVDAVAWEMEEGSICGLGTAAPAPLRSVLRYWPEALGGR
jgi:NADH:ubiquinone oxidoreductase subunit F (NADH-binding)